MAEQQNPHYRKNKCKKCQVLIELRDLNVQTELDISMRMKEINRFALGECTESLSIEREDFL